MEQMKLGNQAEQGLHGLNLQNAGFYGADGKKTDSYMSGSGIAKTDAAFGAFSVEHGEKTQGAGNLTGNFEEYLKEKQARAKEEGEDARSRERETEEEARELASALSSEELMQLRMMGVDVSSAALDDVMGMVNTMRQNAHQADMQAMLAQAVAADGGAEDLTIAGSTIKLAGTDVELPDVSVADVVAERTGDQTQNSFTPTDDDFVYLIRNNLDFNKDNLYRAHFSGNQLQSADDPAAFDEMREQIEKLVAQAGLPKEQGVGYAKLLYDNELPVTAENLRTLHIYKKFEQTPAEQIDAQTAESVRAELVSATPDKAETLYNNVENIAPEMVFDMAREGRPTTIAAALAYMDEKGYRNIGDYYKANTEHVAEIREMTATEPQDRESVTALRQMEEIRFSMTVQVSYRMLKADINIDTRELSKVILDLRRVEAQLTKEAFARAGVEDTEANRGLIRDITQAVTGIAEAPAQILASPLESGSFTVRSLYAEATSYVQRTNITAEGESADGVQSISRMVGNETVRRSYEAVGTAPRADMGDSIKKAFANVEDMLKEMNLPTDYEHQRAVRILGYNSMEITEESITSVMHYDRQVNDLISGFYPEAVLGMIKDGINPMDVPVDELNATLKAKNYNAGVTEADNFASYLIDMEKQGNITQEERESYIGIYRVMNRLAKSGDREAGWLFANGSRLTVRNLITAMRSREARGLNAGVDDEFGMLTQSVVSGKRMDLQIETAFANSQGNAPQQDSEASVRAEEEQAELARAMEQMTEETREILSMAELPTSAVNIFAANAAAGGELYDLVRQLAGKLAIGREMRESSIIDEEADQIERSLGGEDIDIEIPDVSAQNLLRHLNSSGEMVTTFDRMREQMELLMYRGGETGTFTARDLASMKTVQAGFNLMSSMAGRGHYRIPVDTAEGTKIMNLTVEEGGENRGGISVGITGETMGYVKAELFVSASGVMTGSVTAETAEGNETLMAQAAQFTAAFASIEIDAQAVSFGQAALAGARQNADGADISKSYAAAKTFVETIGSILS